MIILNLVLVVPFLVAPTLASIVMIAGYLWLVFEE